MNIDLKNKMSYQKMLQNFIAMDNNINNFLDRISTKYNIDKHELKKDWNPESIENDELRVLYAQHTKNSRTVGDNGAPATATSHETTTNKKINNSALLLSLKKIDLQKMCRERGLKVSGNKRDLVIRLSSETNSGVADEGFARIKKKTDNKDKKPVIKTLQTKIPTIQIRNIDGRYIHEETSIVFNENRKAIGKLVGEETVELSENDIDICNKFKFDFKLPTNLDNQNKSIDSSKDLIDEYNCSDEDKDNEEEPEDISEVDEDEDNEEEFEEYEEEYEIEIEEEEE